MNKLHKFTKRVYSLYIKEYGIITITNIDRWRWSYDDKSTPTHDVIYDLESTYDELLSCIPDATIVEGKLFLSLSDTDDKKHIKYVKNGIPLDYIERVSVCNYQQIRHVNNVNDITTKELFEELSFDEYTQLLFDRNQFLLKKGDY